MFKTDTELGVSALVFICVCSMIAQRFGVDVNVANIVAISVGAIAALIKGVSTPSIPPTGTVDSTETTHTETKPDEPPK